MASPRSIWWGSGSSAGTAHLRYNWVEFAILGPECRATSMAGRAAAGSGGSGGSGGGGH